MQPRSLTLAKRQGDFFAATCLPGARRLMNKKRPPDRVPAVQKKDTLIKTFEPCSYPVTVCKLTTRQAQPNPGPDAEGHTAVIVFSGIPPADLSFYDLHLN